MLPRRDPAAMRAEPVASAVTHNLFCHPGERRDPFFGAPSGANSRSLRDSIRTFADAAPWIPASAGMTQETVGYRLKSRPLARPHRLAVGAGDLFPALL